MKIGVIVKKVSLRTAAPALAGNPIALVKVGLDEFAALDLTGAEPGQTVLILTGASASKLVQGCPADAAVVGIVSLDKEEDSGYNDTHKRL